MQVSDIEFKSADHVLQEIRDMNVKGGSPFGRAAAWAYRLACEQERFPSVEALLVRVLQECLNGNRLVLHSVGAYCYRVIVVCINLEKPDFIGGDSSSGALDADHGTRNRFS